MKVKIYCLVFLVLIALSCKTDGVLETNFEKLDDKVISLPDYAVPQADLELLRMAGFAGSELSVVKVVDGITLEWSIKYLLDRDILLEPENLTNLVHSEGDQRTTQYRTTNLVTIPRDIKIAGMNILNQTIRNGLTLAVENYNNLNIGLNFQLTFETVTTINQLLAIKASNDIIVKNLSGSGAGGFSGFPSNGNPYSSISIYAGTANFGVDVVEHVLTHEIGHTIGFRHTDWFNRSLSCGGNNINEGEDPDGAIHIPGTPWTTNIDMNSIMKACFNGSESGEFTNFDIIALEEIY